ncbi:glycosyltransferase [candidate division KSB1 bacterium]|nr:glycosyltransferase [candidate division KSB1 bacterium]
MKILMVNKYNYIKGGSERCLFEVTDLLKEKGHQVVPFAMKDEQNVDVEYSRYFVDAIEFNNLNFIEKVTGAPKIIGRIIYSKHAKEKIEELIEAEKPDIAHLHMIDHQISPSILPALKKHGIPIVQSVHQYKVVCPNYRFYIPQKNEICERCLSGNYFHPVIQKCHKNSYAASLLVAMESTIHKMLKLYDHIDYFIAPSKFLQGKLVEGGIPKEKVLYIPHFLRLEEYKPTYRYDDYFIYLGRLSEEKGLVTLLNAMKGIKRSELKIIGDGPQRSELEHIAKKENLKNVQILGKKSGDELKKLVSNATFMIIPSEWYENAPMVIYEAFALAKPVIGADVGGISELIIPGKTGFLFPLRNIKELQNHIEYFLNHRDAAPEFGKRARELTEQKFSEETHYRRLSSVYKSLM